MGRKSGENLCSNSTVFRNINNKQKEGKEISLPSFCYKSLYYIEPWKVLEITSSCCSLVNLMKFTA